jgi:guanyl-specific ribonuclease Sa
MRTFRRARRPLVALVVLVAALAVGYGVRALQTSSTPSAVPTVALSSLPPQVAATVALIRAGGPFPYPANDGVTYHNLERHLPAEPDGYYREYTVPTPGATDRGARRIIAGGGHFWYTADHYASFVHVDVSR